MQFKRRLNMEAIMNNYFCFVPSAPEQIHSKSCEAGATADLNCNPQIKSLLALIIVLTLLFIAGIFPSVAISAPCEEGCCAKSERKDNSNQSCKENCQSTRGNGSKEELQSCKGCCHRDVKCYNACIESGHRCKYCEDNCNYCK